MNTGAHLAAETLKQAGVRRVFSVSGNQILALYDALHGAGIEIVHARHEGAAVHMADAWARLTGLPGACLVTAGPGLANAIGALSLADAAESPVVLLAGHAPLGRAGAFQEMDQVGLARPVTRWSAVAERAADIPDLLAAAFRRARSGRSGPVHLSLPVDVLGGEGASATVPGADAFAPLQSSLPEGLALRVVDLLCSAARPLILAGPSGGRPPVHGPLAAFAAATHVPLLIADHPRGLADPALGRAAQALARADAVLLFAKRQDYRINYGAPPAIAPDCRLVQIDPESVEIGRYRSAEIGITADPPTAARALLEAAQAFNREASSWESEVAALLAAPLPDAGHPGRGDLAGRDGGDQTGLHPLDVFDALAAEIDRTGGDRVCLVVDGGEFGQWARARLRARPPQHLVAEPSGAIGFAVPMALAARLACPEATVVAVAGDGAFGFSAMELETAVRCGVPFLTIVGTDAAWGTERHLQVARYGPDRAVATDLTAARYDLVATGLGAYGEYVALRSELRPALTRALAAVGGGRPALLNVRIRSVPSPAGAPP